MGYITSRFAGTEAYRTSPHLGTDFVYGFKQVRVAIADGVIYKVRNKDNPDLQSYRTIYQTCITDNGVFEIVYEHCWDIFVDKGQIVLEGEPIFTEGNTGDLVFYGGIKVKPEEKDTGKGHHLHLQGRLLKQVLKTSSKGHYIKNLNGTRYKDKDGFYYEIQNYDVNEGWVDLEPYLEVPTTEKYISQVAKIIGFIKHKLL